LAIYQDVIFRRAKRKPAFHDLILEIFMFRQFLKIFFPGYDKIKKYILLSTSNTMWHTYLIFKKDINTCN